MIAIISGIVVTPQADGHDELPYEAAHLSVLSGA